MTKQTTGATPTCDTPTKRAYLQEIKIEIKIKL